MSDLFGGIGVPHWEQPEQRSALLQDMGLKQAASFNQAFQSAYGRKQQNQYQVDAEKRQRAQIDADKAEYGKRMQAFLDAVRQNSGQSPEPTAPDAGVPGGDGSDASLPGDNSPRGWSSTPPLSSSPRWDASPSLPTQTPRWDSDPGMEKAAPEVANPDPGMDRNPPATATPNAGSVPKAFEPKDAFDFIGKHPEWLMDPYIGKSVSSWLTQEGNMLKIQQQASAATLRAESGVLARKQNDRNNAWTDALAGAPNEVRQKIYKTNPDGRGWILDKDGKRLEPDPDSIAIFDEMVTEGGKYTEKAFGFKSNPVLSAKARGDKPTAAVSLENEIEKAEQNAKAAQSGGDQEAFDLYSKRAQRLRQQQKGGDLSEPKFIPLPNGQQAIWIPGSKGIQILRDPKKEAMAKVAYEDWRQSNVSLHSAIKADDKEAVKAWEAQVKKKRAALDLFYKQTEQKPDAVAPAAPTAPSGTNSFNVEGYKVSPVP